MDSTNALARITDQPLDPIAESLSHAVRAAYEAAGPVGQQAKNAMQGVWLRHPLHPVFTDLPIGAWTTGLVLDAVAARTHDHATQQAAGVAIGVGLAGAAAAAVTGQVFTVSLPWDRRSGTVSGDHADPSCCHARPVNAPRDQRPTSFCRCSG